MRIISMCQKGFNLFQNVLRNEYLLATTKALWWCKVLVAKHSTITYREEEDEGDAENSFQFTARANLEKPLRYRQMRLTFPLEFKSQNVTKVIPTASKTLQHGTITSSTGT